MYNMAEKPPSILSSGKHDHFAKIIVRHCGTVRGDYFEKSLLGPWQTRTQCCGHIVAYEFE